MDTPHPKKSTGYLSLSLLILAVVVVVSIVFTITAYMKERSINDMNQKIAAAQQEADGILTDDIRTIRQAQQLVQRVRGEKITWSPIVRELLSLLPNEVALTSLSGNNEGKLNAQFTSSSIEKVTRTIELLAANPLFKNTFVPSVAIGSSAENTSVVTFPLTIDLSQKGRQNTDTVNSNTNN